ncbi:AraC family transcriptional regulator [Vibrio sp. Isolate25]|uniref:AraC family transcriptional regulator n=1 Tax=Vibrio TaxID=662 RepID=UPI001EFD56DB|nr:MULTISPECIES: AraC family transcriptional regulator [Vibrio]MCG9595758.1 AraC family transcriptional regulator [Vibrio sp. Isolate25]USD35330.1 AraC family transcriptional regulator [Vibrio sp. SCSIO 43186]USD48396.1 AraC family transcriptional regulator [Vibrio sp. SCSIO 43145]USD72455.1 AraC family transcriptional regulator [Vibrio sp. SCSIO 43139]USD98130.1 AraC family transcriptional regulator [Vibrio coralliilyticus]
MTLAQLMQQYVDTHNLNDLEGVKKTELDGIWFYRSSKGNSRKPFVYQSGVIVLGQGHKNIHIGNQPVQYGPNDYLVVGVPMPLECEAIPTDGEPLMGLTIDIDSQLLHRQVNKLEELGFSPRKDNMHQTCGLRSVSMEASMLDVCIRIMKALCNPVELALLGDALKEELTYRALTSSEGHVLFDLAHHEGQYARVAKALDKVHRNYSEALSVQHLAEEANMSMSAFHSAFRQITLESPIQYIKKVRLNKAKELIQLEGKKVNDAARLVGYNSASQFSREYKRHFNETPTGLKLAS